MILPKKSVQIHPRSNLFSLYTMQTTAFDLELGFTIPEGDEADATFNDFAFIQTSRSEGDKINRDMIIVAAGTENKVALVDLSSGTPRVTTLVLSSNPENTARKSKRQVEWVRGTPYVWIDGTEESEVYVVNVDTKRVVKTIKDQFTTKLLTVENFERKHTLALIENMISESDFRKGRLFKQQQRQ